MKLEVRSQKSEVVFVTGISEVRSQKSVGVKSVCHPPQTLFTPTEVKLLLCYAGLN